MFDCIHANGMGALFVGGLLTIGIGLGCYYPGRRDRRLYGVYRRRNILMAILGR